MSLRGRLPPAIAGEIWSLGVGQLGDIDIVSATERDLYAVHTGGKIALRATKGALDCRCSCPQRQLCSGITAALVVADLIGWPDQRAGALGLVHNGVRLKPKAGAVADENRLENDARLVRETLADERTEDLARWRRMLGDTGLAANRDTWQARIEEVRRVMLLGTGRPPLGGAELWYVVEAEASWTSGRLVVSLATRRPRRDGTDGALRTCPLKREQVGQLPPADRRIVSLLAGPVDASEKQRIGPSFELEGPQAVELMPAMCATGHCVVRRTPELEPRQLAWDNGPPFEFWLEARPAAAGARYELTGTFRRGAEVLEMVLPDLATASGLVIARGVAARLEHFGAFSWIPVVRPGPIVVPRADAAELQRALLDLPLLPRLYLPEELRVREQAVRPRPTVSLHRRVGSDGAAKTYEGRLSFDYDGHRIELADPHHGFFHDGIRSRVARDRAVEAESLEEVFTLGARPPAPTDADADVTVTAKQLPDIVRGLVQAGFEVDLEGGGILAPGKATIEVTSGIDWFDLDASIDYGGIAVPVPELLRALDQGSLTVPLPDGSFGFLPEDWLDDNRALFDGGEARDGGEIRFARSQLPVLDVLLSDETAVHGDKGFMKARQALHGFDGIKSCKPPRTFRGRLRGYQEDGLAWLKFLQKFGFGGCLADDMGLGKTAQVLALLAGRAAERDPEEPRPSLVVVPRSLVHHWVKEAEKFAPKLVVRVHFGGGRQLPADDFAEVDLVVTTYGTLRRDAVKLSAIRLGYCVLDEAQAVKNPTTKTSKSVRLLRAHHRLALSGTPVENHIGELWSLFEFLNPGMLGTAAEFKRTYSGGDDAARTRLTRVLRPFVLRRTKGKVARELPEKLEETLYCELEGPQRARYDELRTFYRESLLRRVDETGLNRSKMHVLEALLRLRQAACHVGLIDKSKVGEPSAKLELLLSQLEQVVDEGHKALVFSQFTSFLAIVRTELDKRGIAYEYLDGRTRKRSERVRRFQEDGKVPLFLISLKAGGLGLNLTAAEYVYLLDPWWNPAAEAQAIDRAHRIGQERRVFAYRLIGRDTIEEKVLALQDKKRDLAAAIIRADASLIKDLKREDLEHLLS